MDTDLLLLPGWKKKAAEWAEDDYRLFTTMREEARVCNTTA
jgi:hypothetical protein